MNVYEMSYVGASYETPRITEYEKYKTDRGFITDQEAIDHLNNWGGKYFIGTQAEYDALKTPVEVYFSNGKDDATIGITSVNLYDNIVDGKTKNPFDIVKESFSNAIEKTKAEYDAYMNEQQKIYEAYKKEKQKTDLAQDNVFLSSAKVAQQVLLKLIAQQINGNQETISMNLSKISEANETVIRKILSGNSSIADVALLGLNVRYRSLNTELHTDNADLEAYALALSTLKVEEMTGMYDDVINNSMSVGDAFQKEMKKQLPTTKEVQLGKELHETFVIQTIGQTNYDKFLDIFKDLDLTTHLSAFTVLKAQASKIPVDHNTDGIPI